MWPVHTGARDFTHLRLGLRLLLDFAWKDRHKDKAGKYRSSNWNQFMQNWRFEAWGHVYLVYLFCSFVRLFLCLFVHLYTIYGRTCFQYVSIPVVSHGPFVQILWALDTALAMIIIWSYDHQNQQISRNAACRGQTTGHRGLELAWRWILGIEQHVLFARRVFARCDSDAQFNDI